MAAISLIRNIYFYMTPCTNFSCHTQLTQFFSFLMSVHTLTDKCKPKYLWFSKWTPNCVPYNGRFQNSIFFNVYQAVAASVYIILLSCKKENDSLGLYLWHWHIYFSSNKIHLPHLHIQICLQRSFQNEMTFKIDFWYVSLAGNRYKRRVTSQ